MKTWAHVVRDARLMYLNRDRFAYLWGANGEFAENLVYARHLIDQANRMNPEHFKKYVLDKGKTFDDLARHIVGKKLFDCSSSVCALTQSEGNYYDLKVVTDMNSWMLHDVMVDKTTPVDGDWGSILWTDGHVAVDTGNGLAFDFACEFVDIREYRHIDEDSPTKFRLSGHLPWVDYSGGINV